MHGIHARRMKENIKRLNAIDQCISLYAIDLCTLCMHDAYCTYYQLLMYATYVIDRQSCCRLMTHHTNDIECYTIIHVMFVTNDVSTEAELWSIDVLLAQSIMHGMHAHVTSLVYHAILVKIFLEEKIWQNFVTIILLKAKNANLLQFVVE